MTTLSNSMVAALKSRLGSGQVQQLPEGGLLLWRAFCELSGARSMHFSGPNPISYSEIEAWCRLRRYPLAEHHVAIIRAMDAAWLEHAYADQKTAQGTPPRSSGHAITAAAFDAVFG